jgi:hypothetical protein
MSLRASHGQEALKGVLVIVSVNVIERSRVAIPPTKQEARL